MTNTTDFDWEQCECNRCIGKGIFRNWSHIAGGACFACKGVGFFWMRRVNGRTEIVEMGADGQWAWRLSRAAV